MICVSRLGLPFLCEYHWWCWCLALVLVCLPVPRNVCADRGHKYCHEHHQWLGHKQRGSCWVDRKAFRGHFRAWCVCAISCRGQGDERMSWVVWKGISEGNEEKTKAPREMLWVSSQIRLGTPFQGEGKRLEQLLCSMCSTRPCWLWEQEECLDEIRLWSH